MLLNARFDSKTFPSLVATLLPYGGDIALLMHAYVDESGTHDGANIMAMAGYLLSDDQAKKFSHDWGSQVVSQFEI